MDPRDPEVASGRVAQVISDFATAHALPFEQPAADLFVITIPGDRKRQTPVLIAIGPHSVTVNAFVIRGPAGNRTAFYEWLLKRNRVLYGVAYCLDAHGDVFLSGKVAPEALDEAELDRLLGTISDNADGAFNTLLELGFADAIRREWRWRAARGEPTDNLTAFEHLSPRSEPELGQDDRHG